jgi:hypothetical protein
MKRLLLLALIFTSPAFAQEETENEETQVEIRMETLGDSGAEVAAASGSSTVAISAFKDRSVWYFRGNTTINFCWVDEDNEPHCKEVKPE